MRWLNDTNLFPNTGALSSAHEQEVMDRSAHDTIRISGLYRATLVCIRRLW